MNFSGSVKLNPVGIFVLLGFSFILLLYMFANTFSNEKPVPTLSVNLKNLLAVAIHAAEQGGEIVRLQGADFNKITKGKTNEGADEYVTDADFKSHCRMYAPLYQYFPTVSIISEEDISLSDCERKNFLSSEKHVPLRQQGVSMLTDVYVSSEDVTVWIDPLDATQEFTEHLTKYVTTMVCVAVKGKPIIGVIHQPFDEHKVTSWAWISFALSPDVLASKKNLAVSVDNPNIIVSRSHAGEVEKMAKNVFPKATVIPAGGSGYKVVQLIKGNASVYVHETAIKKWDICAGDAILTALGGRMSTLLNETIDYSRFADKVNKNGLLASAKSHDQFYVKFKSV